MFVLMPVFFYGLTRHGLSRTTGSRDEDAYLSQLADVGCHISRRLELAAYQWDHLQSLAEHSEGKYGLAERHREK
jgi:hypothetical protein